MPASDHPPAGPQDALPADRLAALEARLIGLSSALRSVEERLAALEVPADPSHAATARPNAPSPSSAPSSASVAEPADRLAAFAPAVLLPLAGRTLLTLAGAFVLRWLTDAGRVPPALGVGLGFAYALGLLGLADRDGARDRVASATTHGLAAALIGFPLLLESTLRFQLLAPWVGAPLVAVLAAAALGVAARRRLRGLGWAVVAVALLSCLGLMVGEGQIAPPVVALLALGLLTSWLGYLTDWRGPRWPVAAVLDLGVVLLALRSAFVAGPEGPGLALLVVVLLLATTLASVAARTLGMGRPVVPFEVAQVGGALLAGLGSAAFLTTRTGQWLVPFGAAVLALGLASYAVAFAWLRRRQASRTNFHLYAGIGQVLLVAGSALAVPVAAAAAAWAVLGLAAAGLARRQGSRTLALQAVLFAIAASAGTGLLGASGRALLGPAAQPWPALPAGALLALACAVGSAWLTAAAPPRDGWRERWPQAAGLALATFAATGLASLGLAALLGPPGPEADLGAIATGRTAVLACGAALAAWVGTRPAWRELGWLAWPLLALGGLKLLLDDLPHGRPATLVLSFACYGVALILLPRLRSARAAQSSRVG